MPDIRLSELTPSAIVNIVDQWNLHGFEPKRRHAFDALSRVADLLIAGLGMVLLLPVLVLVGVAVKLTSPGPVFYRQQRSGLDGAPFVLFKFRSMIEGAERQGRGLRLDRNDSRVTPLGRRLRSTHFDELPQLWNVLIGDMALVGPRPALTFQKDYYESWERARLQVRPGVTGLAQILAGNAFPWDDRLKIDVYFVHQRSAKLWIWIALLTIRRAPTGFGSVNPDGEVHGWTRGLPEHLEGSNQ